MPLIEINDHQLRFLTELLTKNIHLVSGDQEIQALHQLLALELQSSTSIAVDVPSFHLTHPVRNIGIYD